ncbi:hypothetical protein GH810_06455 [Acetobacterium paludosum]|uniref:Chemotaxis protein CheX n=1 Tax=Acetobacterium paludosum TaxID=52693 RepID=A0A923HWK9_9FIRM|nr:hypothetical protein [Acetobacterium paludosum]MBC3887949.1 hypothetical protein [Acetobacterium paludosum]
MFNQYFGNYLLEKKLIKPEELRMVLAEQKSDKVKLGVLAIDSGYMNAAQVNKIHRIQAAKDRKFGELAIEEGYLTENQLDELLNAQKKSNSLLGQILIDKGFFSLEKYEKVLAQYREDAQLTSDEIQALKNNDITEIAEIFLKTLSAQQDRIPREYFELFLRNIVRFIDDEIRMEPAVTVESYPFDYLVTQGIEGKYPFFSGFAASETVLTRFAAIYAEEELAELDALAKDSLGEFLNCHNGLFLSELAHKGIELDLQVAEVKAAGIVNPAGKLYIIPCHLSFGQIDFIFADAHPDFSETRASN